VRGSRLRFPGLRIGVLGQYVDRGLVRAQDRLCRQGGLHRLVEPGVLKPLIEPAAGLAGEPGRDRHPEQHRDQVRGPLGGHVPVPAQQYRAVLMPGP